MIRARAGIFLFLLIMLATEGSAQVNDAQMWLSASAEKQITRGFSVSLEQEVRLVENITEAGTIYTNLEARYRLLKQLSLGAAYRLSLKRRSDDSYALYNSWYFEGNLREKFKPIGVALRIRYQSKYAETSTTESSATPRNHLRLKMSVKYDTDRKYEPYVYAECYFNTGVPAAVAFDQLRLCAGVEYRFNRMHSVDLHYLVGREYNVENPETAWVTGLGYQFSF